MNSELIQRLLDVHEATDRRLRSAGHRPEGRRGGRLRRHRLRLHRARSPASTSTSLRIQMHNRGNGKGGGIAAVGLVPEELGVCREVLEDHYMLQVALLDPARQGRRGGAASSRPSSTSPPAGMLATVDDWTTMPGPGGAPAGRVPLLRPRQSRRARRVSSPRTSSQDLDRAGSGGRVRLPELLQAEREVLRLAGREAGLRPVARPEPDDPQDRRLRRGHRASTTGSRTSRAHVWIAHQRFPTKGRVWHPGGAHPFTGMNEALVHNGDFANYHSVCEYLPQRNIRPQFLTDTEVSVLLFDLWNRTYHYSARVHHRGPGADHRAGLRPAAGGEAEDLPADPGHPHPRLARRAVVLHHRPEQRGRTSSSSCWASPTRPCCGRRSSPSATARSRSG